MTRTILITSHMIDFYTITSFMKLFGIYPKPMFYTGSSCLWDMNKNSVMFITMRHGNSYIYLSIMIIIKRNSQF